MASPKDARVKVTLRPMTKTERIRDLEMQVRNVKGAHGAIEAERNHIDNQRYLWKRAYTTLADALHAERNGPPSASANTCAVSPR